MVAFLDSRKQNKKPSSSHPQSIDSRPIGLMTSSINFPLEYLSYESQLYEECFGRPPAGVLREALSMLTLKAMEDSPMSLRSEQIELAWRQMKIERLCSNRFVPTEVTSNPVDSSESTETENMDPNVGPASDSLVEKRGSIRRQSAGGITSSSESHSIIVLEIMMEMVRMFHAGELSSIRADSGSASSASNTPVVDDESSSSASSSSVIDVKDVAAHLEMPLQQVAEEAKKVR
jgi:hypothetical protein